MSSMGLKAHNVDDPLDLLLDDDHMGNLLLINEDIDAPEEKSSPFPMLKFEEDSCSTTSDDEDALTAASSLSFAPVTLPPKPKASGASAPKKRKNAGTKKESPRSVSDAAAAIADAKDSESASNSGGDGEDDVKDAKKQRRLVRNRMSAQLHRERKKAYVDQLEMQLKSKDAECTELRLLMDQLTRENDALRARSGPHDGAVDVPSVSVAHLTRAAGGSKGGSKAAESSLSLCSLTSAPSSSGEESEGESSIGIGLPIEMDNDIDHVMSSSAAALHKKKKFSAEAAASQPAAGICS